MTDLPSSLGIEAVELVAEGPHPRSVTVRVTGRWRRRRAELRGQAMLVVEGPVGRQRFLAMPEPPSLTGAAPGTWRMSFSVPTALVPVLPGRTSLQLGGVMVPLPIGEMRVEGAGPSPPAVARAVDLAPEVDPASGAEPAETPPAVPSPVGRAGPDILEARRARSSELAAESARRRAAELAADVARLERELDGARAESERLRTAIGERERRLRAAEQQVHAEEALRADVEQELSERTRTARHDLTALHGRVADLERELTRMRRAVDEAGHLAAAAEAARDEAERRLAMRPQPEPALPEPAMPEPVLPEPVLPEPVLPEPVLPEPAAAPSSPSPRAEAMRRELELHHVTPAAPSPSSRPRPAERATDRLALRLETVMADRRVAGSSDGERTVVLERELAAAHEEIEAQRAEIEAQREEVEAQRRRTTRAYEAIEFVRGELRVIGAVPSSAPAAPASPSPLSASPSPPAAGPVQAERLSEALARLRERTAPPAPEPPAPEPPPPAPEPPAPEPPPPPPAPAAEPAQPLSSPLDRPVRPWLGKAFRALTKQDPTAAGHLLLALLPAQRAADPHPVAYDLVLSDVLSAHVTVDRTHTHVAIDPTTRPLSEVDFQLVGDLASIARLLRAGPVRRRLGRLAPGRRVARLRGDRARLPALDALIAAPLTLAELGAAGVELDPLLALTVAALMIEPDWTAGERFTIAHQVPEDPSPGAYLHVRDGRPPLTSTEAPHGPVATVLESPTADLLGVLAGATDARLVGDERTLALLRQWLDRAQSG